LDVISREIARFNSSATCLLPMTETNGFLPLTMPEKAAYDFVVLSGEPTNRKNKIFSLQNWWIEIIHM